MQLSLYQPAVTLDMVLAVPNATLSFISVMKEFERHGALGTVIEMAMAYLDVDTPEEALDLINRAALRKGTARVVWYDLRSKRPRNPVPMSVRRFLRELGLVRKKPLAEFRVRGRLLHELVQNWRRGRITPLTVPEFSPLQLKLWNDNIGVEAVYHNVVKGGIVRPDHVRLVADMWSALCEPLLNKGTWYDHYLATRADVPHLRALLRPIFGGGIDALRRPFDPYGSFLECKSLMTLAAMVIHQSEEGPMPHALAEIPVFQRVGIGRVDLVYLRAVDEQPITRRQRQVAYRLVNESSFVSVGEYVERLVQQFNSKIEVRIEDLKFELGDAVNPNRSITPGDVRDGPISTHSEQVRRYIPFALVDTGLRLQQKLGQLEQKVKVTGQLTYAFATQAPVVHMVELEPGSTQEIVKELLVDRWPLAQRNSQARTETQRVMAPLRRAARPQQSKTT